MLGVDAEPGIYLRTLTDLFQAIEGTRDDMDYSVSMSYLEVSLPARLSCLTCRTGQQHLQASGSEQLSLCSCRAQACVRPAPTRLLLPASLHRSRFTTKSSGTS